MRKESVRRVRLDNQRLGSRVTFKRFLIAVSVAIAVSMAVGCERPGDRTPKGFVEQCYGGRHQMARNWVCSNDRLVVTVEGNEADWPVFSRIISDYGRDHGLRFFDTSTSTPNYLRTLGLSVCSSEGLFINVDKRIYTDPSMNRDGNRITAAFRTYRSSFDWKQLADDFEGTFRKNWSGPVQVDWPEAQQKRALPDSVKSCEETRD